MRCATAVWIGLVLGASAGGALAGDWITAPSYFTHDPQTGARTQQYAPIGPFYMPSRDDYVRSGFRHTRSSIQAGTSADHVHVVEQWGLPVQPYGEWRFPHRPYSVPYPLWGPPYPGWGWGGYLPPLPFPPGGHPPGGHPPGQPWPHPPYHGGVNPPPWQDGNYSELRDPRLPDRLFFRPPNPGP